MIKKKYKIYGLDCPHCALEVEEELNKDEKIEKASIDFVNKNLFVIYANDSNIYQQDKLLNKILEIETGISLAENEENAKKQTIFQEHLRTILKILFSGIILLCAELIPMQEIIAIIMFAVAYLIVAYEIIWKALKGLWKRNFFSENTLMMIATIGAFAIGEYPEAVLVMLLSTIGEMLQDISIGKSRKMILDTIDLRPKTANKIVGEQIEVTDIDALLIDDILIIKVGEIVPVDGIVLDGQGSIDTSVLTGESLPQEICLKKEILSGSVLRSGYLKLRVTKLAKDSSVSKIVDMMSEFGERKANTEKFITRFAKIYTPIIFALALLIGIVPPLFVGEWTTYLYRGLIFLVISCPCAIVISVPLAFFTGIGLAAKHGVLVKGASYLEDLANTKTFVFDKTGTLTKAAFAVQKKEVRNINEEDFIEYLVVGESLSNHPIAKAIVSSFGYDGQINKVDSAKEIAGEGIVMEYRGKKVLIGNHKLLDNFNVDYILVETSSVVVYLAVDNLYCGYVLLADQIKTNSAKTVKTLSNLNIRTIMLTGDRQDVAMEIANSVGIDEYYFELLPEDKVHYLTEILENNQEGKVAFVGDGINDAPSILLADLGIAMGGIGSDIAVETADIVLMNDDPLNVLAGIKIGRATKKQAILNIYIALGVKVLYYGLAAFGLATMWMAVVADVGLTVFLIFFTLLLANKKINK